MENQLFDWVDTDILKDAGEQWKFKLTLNVTIGPDIFLDPVSRSVNGDKS